MVAAATADSETTGAVKDEGAVTGMVEVKRVEAGRYA